MSEGVLGDDDLEEIPPLGEVRSLEVEGDRYEALDVLDGGGLSP
jgi:hypothetical protein